MVLVDFREKARETLRLPETIQKRRSKPCDRRLVFEHHRREAVYMLDHGGDLPKRALRDEPIADGDQACDELVPLRLVLFE